MRNDRAHVRNVSSYQRSDTQYAVRFTPHSSLPAFRGRIRVSLCGENIIMLIRLESIALHVGETVTIEGWLYDKTDKGKLAFLQVRDGTGIAQAVVFAKE
ncbi:MAG TPA: OB-fold nucleic acid binding domain-containing protein, partial [Anaerolineae bacterium]